jgi:hypothetical protein
MLVQIIASNMISSSIKDQGLRNKVLRDSEISLGVALSQKFPPQFRNLTARRILEVILEMSSQKTNGTN